MDNFIAEIRIFPFKFAPRGWAMCNGQLMSIPQNTALFSIIGTVYGGDGKSTFALPNLQGRAPMHPGQGTGLSAHSLGEISGSEKVTLAFPEMASHSHNVAGTSEPGELKSPGNSLIARSVNGNVYAAEDPNVQMAQETITPTGSSQAHNNMQPYLTTNFCIALQGNFPPRS